MRSFAEPHAPAPWTVLLLAGGASRRFGGAPKATARIDGVPAVQRMVELSAEAGFERCLVVAGRHLRETQLALGAIGPLVLENPDWEAGRTGSIQVGLRASAGAAGVLLWPVDHPFVEAKSLLTLRRCAETDPMAVWFIPTFEGRGGHPVLLRPPTFTAILGLPPDGPLRSLLASFGPQVRRVPTDDPGVLENVDDPVSFDAAMARRRADEARGRWTDG
ncbi:MAG: nucleotidyltransferase family protein [Thermoplasmata archaeon]|jgi:molybdenum cofactor cytidylyltransferase|nr:nucleotidyltransferase family protein [Thermoplasmata archaeon]